MTKTEMKLLAAPGETNCSLWKKMEVYGFQQILDIARIFLGGGNYMVINLTKSVPLKELCRISAYGYTTKIAHDMEFTFSHEAMVGFATELLWMYEDINENRKLSLCTHPLQSVPNQVIGFYLTPDSPVLLFKVNSLNGVEKGGEYESWKEIYIKTKNINQYYEVREPLNEADGCISVELYEFRRKNIVNIAIPLA